MTFLIEALSETPFAKWFGASSEALADRGIERVVADTEPGYPCRVSFRDARVGESLLLLNYTHHDVATPYRSSHAIFVIEGATRARPLPGEIPEVLARRLMSVRAFDRAGNMIHADVVDGVALRSCIEGCFDRSDVDYLHLHNARPGCFAARVVRAERSADPRGAAISSFS
ncbi:MAG: DUF1203 domain-containing protein [Myxococcota bacterium]